MAFSEALQDLGGYPFIFTVVPPRKGANPDTVEQHLERVAELVREVALDAVNVPQVVGGQFETVEAERYALLVQQATKKEAIVNAIVATKPEPELLDWARRAWDQGLRHVILVGGERSNVTYPGPSVTRANALVRKAEPRFTVGNITIPTRRPTFVSRRNGGPRAAEVLDEPDRLLKKAEAGSQYFTSQIVTESETTKRLLHDYVDLCRARGVPPARVFVSLAPVTSVRDLDFLKDLEVHIPPDVEEALRTGDPETIAERSLRLNLRTLRELLEYFTWTGIRLPLGINVEHVSYRNWDASVRLARYARELTEEYRPLLGEEQPAQGMGRDKGIRARTTPAAPKPLRPG